MIKHLFNRKKRNGLSLTLLMLGLLSAGYTLIINALESGKLALVLLVVPVFLGLVLIPGTASVLLVLLVIALSFSARFRPPGIGFHSGGAELSIAPVDFALFALLLILLPQILRRPQSVRAKLRPIYVSFALFLGAHLLSLFPAANRSLVGLETLRLLKMILLVLVIIYYANSRRRLRFIFTILLLTMIVQGSLAVVQSVFRASFGLGFLGEHEFWTIAKGSTVIGRAGGTMGHANVLANFFEAFAPISFAIILSGLKGRLRYLAYGALLASLIGTFLTFSRAGWASLALGLLLCAFQYRKRLPMIRIIWGLLVAGIAGGLLGLIFRKIIIARLLVFWEGSKVVRLITAETAFNMIRSNPLLGIGANNYVTVSYQYLGELTPGLRRTAAGVVHNIILLYAAELGLVGMIALFIFLFAVMKMGRQVIQNADPFLAALGVGTLAGIVALLAHGMWDWLLRYDPVFTLFWFSIGLLAAIWNVMRQAQIPEEDKNSDNPKKGKRPLCAAYEAVIRGDAL